MRDLAYSVEEPFYGLDFANANNMVPRRLRVPGLVDRRLLGPIDFNTDARVHYWYHADDSASVTQWVSGGRASGWNDDGPKGFHLNSYDSPLGQRPFYYPSVSYFNDMPAIYAPSWYNADTTQIQYHVLIRSDPYMYYNNDNSGSGMAGWYFGIVFAFETAVGNASFYKWCCSYPPVLPWRSGVTAGPKITEEVPKIYAFDTEQAYIFSEHCQFNKGAQRILSLRTQGQPRRIVNPYKDIYGGYPSMPVGNGSEMELGINSGGGAYGSWTIYHYWAEVLLMYGNISLQEVNWIETHWASKYGITLEKE